MQRHYDIDQKKQQKSRSTVPIPDARSPVLPFYRASVYNGANFSCVSHISRIFNDRYLQYTI